MKVIIEFLSLNIFIRFDVFNLYNKLISIEENSKKI